MSGKTLWPQLKKWSERLTVLAGLAGLAWGISTYVYNKGANSQAELDWKAANEEEHNHLESSDANLTTKLNESHKLLFSKIDGIQIEVSKVNVDMAQVRTDVGWLRQHWNDARVATPTNRAIMTAGRYDTERSEQ